jgi:hypothetical protein
VPEARVASARAARDAARGEAAPSRLVAPLAGTVLAIQVRPGQQVGNGGVLDLSDLSEMQVVAEVYETDLPRVRLGAAAEVVVPGEARRLTARVVQIGWPVRRSLQATTDPVAAVEARTVEVRLALDGPAPAVFVARGEIALEPASRAHHESSVFVSRPRSRVAGGRRRLPEPGHRRTIARTECPAGKALNFSHSGPKPLRSVPPDTRLPRTSHEAQVHRGPESAKVPLRESLTAMQQRSPMPTGW